MKVKTRSHFTSKDGVKSTERKFKDRDDLHYKDKKGEEQFPSEKVVPNKALKPRDVIDRFTRGVPLQDVVGAKPVWLAEDATHESPDLEKLRDMDRMEKKDFVRSARVKFKPPKPSPAPKVDENPKTE